MDKITLYRRQAVAILIWASFCLRKRFLAAHDRYVFCIKVANWSNRNRRYSSNCINCIQFSPSHLQFNGTITNEYRGVVFNEQFPTAEEILGGRNGQISEQTGHSFDGYAAPMRPSDHRQHLVTLQEPGVRLAEDVAALLHLTRFQ